MKKRRRTKRKIKTKHRKLRHKIIMIKMRIKIVGDMMVSSIHMVKMRDELNLNKIETILFDLMMTEEMIGAGNMTKGMKVAQEKHITEVGQKKNLEVIETIEDTKEIQNILNYINVLT